LVVVVAVALIVAGFVWHGVTAATVERVWRQFVDRPSGPTARIILLGIAMDAIYQFIVLKRFYPVEALIVAIALAFVPYVLLRGPIDRAAGRSAARRPLA